MCSTDIFNQGKVSDCLRMKQNMMMIPAAFNSSDTLLSTDYNKHKRAHTSTTSQHIHSSAAEHTA